MLPCCAMSPCHSVTAKPVCSTSAFPVSSAVCQCYQSQSCPSPFLQVSRPQHTEKQFSPMPKEHFRNSLKERNTEAMILEQYLLVTNRVRTIPPGWEEAWKSCILVGQTGWKKHRSEAFTDTMGLNSGREERTAPWAGEMAQRIKTLLSNLRI